MSDVGITHGTSPAAADSVLEFGIRAKQFALTRDDICFRSCVRKLLQISLQKPRWEWFRHLANCPTS
jgi:hypothetical protein